MRSHQQAGRPRAARPRSAPMVSTTSWILLRMACMSHSFFLECATQFGRRHVQLRQMSFLEHDASEGGIVISGALEVTVGPQTRVLKEGEAYLFNSRVPHRFRNISDSETIVVSACTPPYL